MRQSHNGPKLFAFFLWTAPRKKRSQQSIPRELKMNPAEETHNDLDAEAAAAAPMSKFTSVRPVDVICSREPRFANHKGNQDYALTIMDCLLHHPSVNMDVKDWDWTAVSKHIVYVIRGRGGRFLGKTRVGTWADIGDGLATRWVTQHLRQVTY